MSPPNRDTGLVGIDLGGTNIRAAVATGPTAHGPRRERRTPRDGGPDAILQACADLAREAAGGQPSGIAIGIPGPLNPRTGVVFAAPHLPGFENFEAGPTLQRMAGCPVTIHNDANLAGYAEWVAGAGRGTRIFLFMTISTGIGGAIVVNGDLYSGAAGTAAEIGHQPVTDDGPVCGQGHRGCVEGVGSGSAIAARAAAAIAAGMQTSLASGDPQPTAEAVAVAAHQGDDLAVGLYEEAGHAVGRVLGGAINLLSPEVIVIGGGMINNAELFLPQLRLGIAEIGFAVPVGHCRLELAQLGTDAGLVGATAWAMRSFASTP